MEGQVCLLCFDQVYQTPYGTELPIETISLTDIRGTYGYCHRQSLLQIKKRLKRRKRSKIYLLGSGNYHYVTLLLLEELTSPFTLVLFDHHTDLLPSPTDSLVSCGSWVLNAIKEVKLLKKVVIIGVKQELVLTIPEELHKKVNVFTTSRLRQDRKALKAIVAAIPTPCIYVSVDKDVLDRTAALTNWDQGDLRLDELLELIQLMSLSKFFLGTDICGEYTVSGTNQFCPTMRQATRLNYLTNKRIIEAMQAIFYQQQSQSQLIG